MLVTYTARSYRVGLGQITKRLQFWQHIIRRQKMSKKCIVVEDLVKRYKELVAIDHLNLTINEGEIFGLLGPNGSGKTTTINCILSLLEFDKGTITVFGEEMKPTSYEIKRKIGVVMQDVAVFDDLTVYENVDAFCGLYISDKATRKKYVEEAITLVGLEDYKKFLPKKLSGGLLRRLNIACGIAHKPSLIFLDEPTVAIDPQSRNHILTKIMELNKSGATIVYTSHYMEEVEQICDRIAILDSGKVIALGTKDELRKSIKKSETIVIESVVLSDEQLEHIKQIRNVYKVTYVDQKLTVLCTNGSNNLMMVLAYLQEQNVGFGHVYSMLPTLNDVFLEITGKELRD